MAPDRRQPRVVVVDDDLDTRELYQLVLESVGYRVESAATVASATLAFRRGVPDVVLTDWLLPDGDGDAVCAALSAEAATCRVPAVVLSGLKLPDDVEAQARQRGLVAVLEKPADPDRILNAIADALVIGVERRVRAAAARTKRYVEQVHRRAARLRTPAGSPAEASALLARAAARSGGSICLMIADDHARYVAAGGPIHELTGYEPAELTQLTVWDLTPVGVTSDAHGLWTQFISAGRQEGHYTLRRRDGGSIGAGYCAVANIAPGWHVSALAELPAMPISLAG